MDILSFNQCSDVVDGKRSYLFEPKASVHQETDKFDIFDIRVCYFMLQIVM